MNHGPVASRAVSRAEPLVAEMFEAFNLSGDGAMRFLHSKPTFEECRDLAAAGTPHKQQFAVKVSSLLSGAVTLHVFQIRKGARRYVVRDHIPQFVQDHRAELVSVIRIVEPQYPDETARRVGLPLGSTRPIDGTVEA